MRESDTQGGTLTVVSVQGGRFTVLAREVVKTLRQAKVDRETVGTLDQARVFLKAAEDNVGAIQVARDTQKEQKEPAKAEQGGKDDKFFVSQ